MTDDNEGFGGPAQARHDDPISSHMAAADVEEKGTARTDRIWALEAIHKHPGKTSRELAKLIAQDMGLAWTDEIRRMKMYEKLHRRLPELRMVGLARGEVIEPECAITRRKMQRWWYTGPARD